MRPCGQRTRESHFPTISDQSEQGEPTRYKTLLCLEALLWEMPADWSGRKSSFFAFQTGKTSCNLSEMPIRRN